MNGEIGVYIHIPFCFSKCFYCDFASYSKKEDKIESYINALCTEIIQNAEILSEYSITTIYIGGGTPSYIDSKYIKQILDTLNIFINKEKLQEITIELNPNSVTKEKLETYKECGINRLSIGLQSTHDSVLKKIGRVHKFNDFKEVLDLSNNVGFDNISLDLIYPLPDLSLSEFKDSVDYVVSLKDKNIKHISIYNLEVHEGSKLDFILNEGYASLVDEDVEYEMYKYLVNKFEENGYKRYETSNYALPGYESKHNLKYWNQEQYLGFGSNASSFFCGVRSSNIKDIESYIESINNNCTPKDDESYEDLDKDALEKEYVMLSLRKIDGVNKNKFKIRYKKDIHDVFAKEIDELKKDNLIIEDETNIYLSKRGLEVANIVWERFI